MGWQWFLPAQFHCVGWNCTEITKEIKDGCASLMEILQRAKFRHLNCSGVHSNIPRFEVQDVITVSKYRLIVTNNCVCRQKSIDYKSHKWKLKQGQLKKHLFNCLCNINLESDISVSHCNIILYHLLIIQNPWMNEVIMPFHWLRFESAVCNPSPPRSPALLRSQCLSAFIRAGY